MNGTIFSNGVTHLEQHEIDILLFLTRRGYDVELVPPSNQLGEKTSDTHGRQAVAFTTCSNAENAENNTKDERQTKTKTKPVKGAKRRWRFFRASFTKKYYREPLTGGNGLRQWAWSNGLRVLRNRCS